VNNIANYLLHKEQANLKICLFLMYREVRALVLLCINKKDSLKILRIAKGVKIYVGNCRN